MTAMEKMLASMLGITPEQMQATIKSAVELLANIDGNLKQMANQIDEIHRAMFARGPHVIEGEVIGKDNDDAQAA